MGILKDEIQRLKGINIGFGAASISGEGAGYGFGDMDATSADKLLNNAYDLGFRLFDTAPIYGFGESERRLGQTFKGSKRHDVFIISKSGVTWDQNKRVDMSNDPKIAQTMLETSLKDLKTDMIDLYMVHWPDEKVDIRKVMEVYVKAQEAGKIRFIGLCNTHTKDLALASEIATIEAVQSQFNVFEDGLKKDFLPELEKQDISFMSWGTLDKGILTGRVDEKRKFDKSDCRSWAPWWKSIEKGPRYEAVRQLKAFLDTRGHSLLEFALGYNLSAPALEVPLCGARSHEQAETLVKALGNLPGKEILLEGKDIVDSIFS
jgi:aryl-alcohol dehydrogenase-like predicted oxidoreductase